MNVYLAAVTDEKYDACAYAFIVGNSEVIKERKFGCTVVEEYLNGFIGVNRYIISNNIYLDVTDFVLCTASPVITKIIKTDYLEKLESHKWRKEDGKYQFYVPQLKELLLMKRFYAERGVSWAALNEVKETDYHFYEICVNAAKSIL